MLTHSYVWKILDWGAETLNKHTSKQTNISIIGRGSWPVITEIEFGISSLDGRQFLNDTIIDTQFEWLKNVSTENDCDVLSIQRSKFEIIQR